MFSRQMAIHDNIHNNNDGLGVELSEDGDADRTTTTSDLVESKIRADFDAGSFDAAATRFIQQYGGEILGFLVGRLGNASEASDVFSTFTEDFWHGLPKFQWRTSIRGWGYTLARNAFSRHLNHRRKRKHVVPMPCDTEFQIEAGKVRTTTAMYLRTEVKTAFREIREQLPRDDQTLLVLRIDRGLSWNELAAIFSGLGEELTPEDRRRWAARLRQRFQALKDRLRTLAAEQGLLPKD